MIRIGQQKTPGIPSGAIGKPEYRLRMDQKTFAGAYTKGVAQDVEPGGYYDYMVKPVQSSLDRTVIVRYAIAPGACIMDR
tara:strand:- start:787 stop:1026 length:240 start_codon:yes stop_codon:yes gene_type:complete